MQSPCYYYIRLTVWLESLTAIIPLLALRLLLAWEFGESGYEKYIGTNWFNDLAFPFPLNLVPANVSWTMAMGFELVGAAALVLGLATRFFSLSLMVLTVVAIMTVHWPEHWNTLAELLRGYRIVDEEGDGFGNYKLPVIYLVMFLPLVFQGAGKWSMDAWLRKRWCRI